MMEEKTSRTSEEFKAVEDIAAKNPHMRYREIALVMNTRFNTDWWDSERVRDRLRKIAKSKNKYLNIVPDIKQEISTFKGKKILVLADGHYPNHREDLAIIFEECVKFVDSVIFGGDMFDNEALSKFNSIQKASFKESLVDFYWFMSELMEKNTRNVPVYVIRGNHEERLAKYIASNQQSELNSFINPQIMQMFADGFDIYDGYEKIHYPPIKNIIYINNWYININDSVLICHQKEYNKPKLKTVCNGIDYFFEVGENFDAIFLAHMHTAGYTRHMNKHGYNIPCMCKPQEYSNNGKFQYKPQAYGYAIVALDANGKFDVNNTKIIHLEEIYNRIDERVQYKFQI